MEPPIWWMSGINLVYKTNSNMLTIDTDTKDNIQLKSVNQNTNNNESVCLAFEAQVSKA